MSRIRIVKRKIYEKIGGDLKYYSEANITEIASETYAEQSVKEISHKGDPGKPSAGEIKAKCLVQFRPHDKWSGEFGFDWIRMGDNDTGRRGDKYWYRDIIGRYRDTNGKLFQVYDGGKFKKENAQYNLLLKEFSLFNITWKKDIYVVPILSLMPNCKSKFTLKIEIKEEPKELIYKINSKYYKLNKYKISHTTVGKKTLYNDLEITNIAPHGGYENLDVIAISKDGSEETVGRIRIKPNSSQHQKKITVALIKVFNSKGNFSSLNLESRKKEITKYLNQALIIPTFVTANIHINRLGQNQRKKFLDAYNGYGDP